MTAARVFPDGRIPVLLSAHDESLLATDAAALLRYLDREYLRFCQQTKGNHSLIHG